MANIISGKLVANELKEQLKIEVSKLLEKGVVPRLDVILVGDDPASQIYVSNKEKMCNELGIKSEIHRLSKETTTDELIDLIEKLNNDNSVSGILLQHPVPKQIDELKAFNSISPDKDVDGFNEINSGRLLMGEDSFVPCTPLGIIELLEHEDIEITGKHCVILGRSNIVGKPMAHLMLKKNATVTICHSKTNKLEEICKMADILIVAIGKDRFVKANMVKEGAVVIDVGINRIDGKLYGDVDFESVEKIASHITPVPGGVGPMTIMMLMKNVIKACSINHF